MTIIMLCQTGLPESSLFLSGKPNSPKIHFEGSNGSKTSKLPISSDVVIEHN